MIIVRNGGSGLLRGSLGSNVHSRKFRPGTGTTVFDPPFSVVGAPGSARFPTATGAATVPGGRHHVAYAFSVKFNAWPLMQKRRPVGGGPSGKT